MFKEHTIFLLQNKSNYKRYIKIIVISTKKPEYFFICFWISTFILITIEFADWW